MFRSFRALTLTSSALLAACAGVADDPADQAGFTDTIVSLHADGTIEQSTRSITAEQRYAEIEQRDTATAGASRLDGSAFDALTLPVDPGCAGADLWIYDSTQANRLCISGASVGVNDVDSIDLHGVTYGRGCLAIDITGRCTLRPSWAGHVQYIWPGSNDGRLYLNSFSNPTAVFWQWGPFQAIDPATTNLIMLMDEHLN